ncbi:hypothetical protein NQF87_02415 [Bombella sp. TMW 2.2559]|uniref:Uncharacterized protein n=1 Tax=Bombella dulcis TaxID=2967339 RepID=A0ABT3WG26_9PROT|nr:hypothetical protein [Bombella dulcis]MCX5615836.1 hypothetical protein [Bombella dulcis]
MAQKAFRVADQTTVSSSSTQGSKAGTVIPFRQKLLPRHHRHLAQWLAASERMGILDASIETASESTGTESYLVVVWVRENADPAYIISLNGPQWVLTDCLRDNELGRYRDLSEALHTIRPVLPLHRPEIASL